MPDDSTNIRQHIEPIIIPQTALPVAEMKLDTAIIGSLRADRADRAAIDTIELTSTVIVPRDNWNVGLEGSARQGSLDGNSGILTIIVVMFVSIAMNFKECRKLFTRFIDELRNSKYRENDFDEHSNHETRLTILTVIPYLIYGGIILSAYKIFHSGQTDTNIHEFNILIKSIGLFSAYYLFQLCAYSLLGYTFAGDDGSKRWIRALNASQSLAGVALMIPALIMLFYPQTTPTVCIISLIIYLAARLIFIAKGFSIFYNNIFSLVYFILYLCALEIIPLIFILKLALLI